MKVLVTGAGGQVGQSLLAEGESSDHQVIGFTRANLDITCAASIASAFDSAHPDIVINAAAYTAVDAAESDSEAAFAANATAPGLLAEACARMGIPLVHISTDYIFDGTAQAPYSETDSENPVSVYGASKLAGERAVQSAVAEHIILRTAWVFSEYGGNFVKTMLRVGAECDELKVVDDQMGGPTSARAIASALLGLVDQYAQNGPLEWGIYHFSQAPHVSWHAFAKHIFEIALEQGAINTAPNVLAVPSSSYPTPVRRPKNSRLNTRKFESLTGITIDTWQGELVRIISALNSSCKNM